MDTMNLKKERNLDSNEVLHHATALLAKDNPLTEKGTERLSTVGYVSGDVIMLTR